MTKNKLICFSLVCGFISTLLFTMIGFSNSCSEIYDNVVRIRIIANSNSKEDQDLKISIRDAVLQKSTQMFDGITSYDDAIKITSENSNELINIARETVSSYGYDYNVFKHNYIKCFHYDHDEDNFGGEEWFGYHEECSAGGRTIARASFIGNCNGYKQLVEFKSSVVKDYIHYINGFEKLLLIYFEKEDKEKDKKKNKGKK